jgi:putative heme-binding domain-containing protein
LDQWLEAIGGLDGAPDPQAGRRIFFHVAGAACSQCHRYEGRGNVVGPDLSLIAKQGTPREILQSILEPNREVAPQFYTTHLELTDGSDFTGILLRSSSNEVYRNGFGQEVTFQKSEIQDRKELRSSLMPSGLLDTMSDREVRNLLAFLLQGSR